MKKKMSLLLAVILSIGTLMGCGGGTQSQNVPETDGTAKAKVSAESNESGKEVEISFPTFFVGVNAGAEWFNQMKDGFNEQYKGKYKVVEEEIPGDQAYIDKMKVLYSSDSLPDVICTGGYNLIDMMKDKMVDLTPYIDADPEWKATLSPQGIAVNSREGKLYGIPYTKQVIGYYYNKELFQKAGIEQPAQTWEEFFQQAEKLKGAGVVPVSMDTADSGWVTSLMLGAMIGQSDTGETFMNTMQPTDYKTTEFIAAAADIQKLFMKYTTGDAVGGKYENAASNFLSGKTAIIANGPWMAGDFYDTAMCPEGFGDKIAVAAYPGGVMYNSGKTGFHVAAKTPEKIEAAVAFVKYMTSAESQQMMMEMTGEIPDNGEVTSDQVKPIINDTIKLAGVASHSINDFQSLWYANVVDEISVQYPLLAQEGITPEAFAAALSAAAVKNN